MSDKMLISKKAYRALIASVILILVAFVWTAKIGHDQGVTSRRTQDTARKTQHLAKIAHHQAEVNERAIRYICSTTTVLDKLVVAAHDQIQTAFSDGQYERLLKQGIATQENIDAAKALLKQYHNSHIKLTSASACDDVVVHK